MKFHQSIFQNNNLKIIKYLSLIVLIFALSFKANTEIPERFKIESSLPKCKGTDYTKWTNCYSEYKFPRIEYKGEWKDGKFHGKGILRELTGNTYVGDFFENKAEGNGAWFYPDGSKYAGEIKEGYVNGPGVYLDGNGGKYEGEIKGFSFKGTFHFPEGQGTYTYSNGSKYVGEFKGGIRQGKGTYTTANGDKYVGEAKNNKEHGQGTLTWANGDKYFGEWKDGKKHGQGTYTFLSGAKYVGEYKDDKRHGQGKMVYADGNIYKGLWEDGKEAEGNTTLAKFTTDEKYFALIIGNNDYEKLEDLDNAVNDAKDLEKVLREKYGFETTLLLNKKSDETEDAIIKFTQNREKNDNILIYYAGHGQIVKKQKLDRGYWLPTDAGPKIDSKWISNINIKDYIGSSDAKHILLIVDSCFSGNFTRRSAENKSVEKLNQNTIERLQKKFTRLVITSGGNEQVADAIGASKNSVFAEPLIKALKNNTDVIRSIELFLKFQNYVINNAQQTPEHALIHGTGHDGGEFLFFPKS